VCLCVTFLPPSLALFSMCALSVILRFPFWPLLYWKNASHPICAISPNSLPNVPLLFFTVHHFIVCFPSPVLPIVKDKRLLEDCLRRFIDLAHICCESHSFFFPPPFPPYRLGRPCNSSSVLLSLFRPSPLEKEVGLGSKQPCTKE
jgi:hypothetical protein